MSTTPPTSPTLFHPLDLFMANMTEVDCLTTIYAHASNYHLTTATEQVCDKHILIKSAIVFIVTCWDEYVKSLVTTAFDFMLTQANTPDIFPKQVKIVVSETLQPPYPDSQDEDPVRRVKQKQRDDWDAQQWKADIWQLAGDGWLTLLRRHQQEILQRYVERFHSPRPDTIDQLLAQLLGLPHLSATWEWPGMTAGEAKKCLNVLLNLRGDIVHSNQSHRPVTREDVDYFSLLVTKLAGISADTVRQHVYQQTRKYPWADTGVRHVPTYLATHCN
jgi:hypothetical protein